MQLLQQLRMVLMLLYQLVIQTRMHAMYANSFNLILIVLQYSPASAPGAIAVGATYISKNKDTRSSFSNWGPCVDVRLSLLASN